MFFLDRILKLRAALMAARMAFLCAGLLATAALAAEPAAEPLEVLRQRLAERLSNKAEPVGGALRVTGKGREEPAKAKSGASNKPGDKAAEGAHAHTPTPANVHAHAHAQGTGLPHWGYAGDVAPERWAELSPEFRQCGIGTRQSPIDIRDGIKVDLEKIQFDYRPSGFAVLDSGHTVQVNLAPGNALQVMGRRYELAQFHFHRPSEERVNGRQFDMVAHLVHKDVEGRLAVVAVLLEQGLDQPLVQTVWNNLPLERGEALPAPGLLDMTQLLPENRAYYTYMGSLTVPPCTEGVLWMVMRQPVQLSAHQLAIFAKLYPMNARPIQAGAGRLIKESN